MLFMSLYLIGIMLTIGGWLFYQHEIDREETFLDELMDHLISGAHSKMFIYALIPGLNIAYGCIYIYKALAIKKVKDTEKEVAKTFSRMMPFDVKKTTSKVKDFFGNISGMFKKKINSVPETKEKTEKKAEENVKTNSVADVVDTVKKTFSTEEDTLSANTQPKTSTTTSTKEKLDTIGKPIKDVIETISEPITEEKPIQKDEAVKTNNVAETTKPTETITSKNDNIATTTKDTAASFTNTIKNTFGF